MHTHACQTERQSDCPSLKHLWSLLVVTSPPDNRHYVPLTLRKPKSEGRQEMLPVPPLRDRLQCGLSTLIRHQITPPTTASSQGKAPEMSESLTTRHRALGKADFGTSAATQPAPRNVIKTAQVNFHMVADNSSWPSRVLLPG